MKLYIDGPEDNGEGRYVLVTEDGELVAGHYCSNASFARGDLVDRPTQRNKDWKARFPDHQVLRVGEDDVTHDELVKRNHIWHADQARRATDGGQEDEGGQA